MLLWPLAIGIGIAMTLELKMLAVSIVLGLIQIVLASHAASLQRGYVWTASSRDEAVPALTGVAGRLARALQNFVETFPLFAAAVLIAHVAATHSWMTVMLPRFGGHPNTTEGGVHNAENTSSLCARIPTPNGRAGPSRTNAWRAG